MIINVKSLVFSTLFFSCSISACWAKTKLLITSDFVEQGVSD